MSVETVETILAGEDFLTQDYITRPEQHWIEEVGEVIVKEVAKLLKSSFLTELETISFERFIKILQEAYFYSEAMKYSSGRLKDLLNQDVELGVILGRAIVKISEYLSEKKMKGKLAAALWEDPESGDEEVILNVYIPASFEERVRIWGEIEKLLNDIDPEFRIVLSIEEQR